MKKKRVRTMASKNVEKKNIEFKCIYYYLIFKYFDSATFNWTKNNF